MTNIVDFDDFCDEPRNHGLVGHLKRVDELDSAVDVLDVLAFEERTTRQLKSRSLVRTATAAMSILANRIDSHAGLETLGESTRGTSFPVERGNVALAWHGYHTATTSASTTFDDATARCAI